MWLLRLALPAAARPETSLLHTPGAIEAQQLWRIIVHLPHRSCEVHVSFELFAGSAALAIAVVTLSDALLQCPVRAVEVSAASCFVAHAATLRSAVPACARRVGVVPLLCGKLSLATLLSAHST